MTKSPDAFRTISEVADWLGIQAHVLRFWESKFSQVKPVKRAGGRRYYRPTDMQLLSGIKKLLYEDGLTIKGVQKILREQGVSHVSGMSSPLGEGIVVTAGDDADDDADTLQSHEEQTAKTEETAVTPTPSSKAPQEVVTAESSEAESGGEKIQEELPLPSFTHRRMEEREEQPEVESPVQEIQEETPDQEEPPAPAAETPAPLPSEISNTPPVQNPAIVVDAPDPPEESEIAYKPGILAELVKFDRLGKENAAAAKPLVQALQDWRIKASGAA